MKNIEALIRQKSRIFIYLTLVYVLSIELMKWVVHPSLDALWFFLGGAIGLYFLDAAEVFFALSPSPFRSVVFSSLFAVVAFFVVTSSSGTIGSGLVLSIYLQMILWQAGEWRVSGHTDSWYRMVAGPVNQATQRALFAGFVALFVFISYLFIR